MTTSSISGRVGVRIEGIENKTLDHQGYTSFCFLKLRNDSLQCSGTTQPQSLFHQSSESAETRIEARTAAVLVGIYAIITGE